MQNLSPPSPEKGGGLCRAVLVEPKAKRSSNATDMFSVGREKFDTCILTSISLRFLSPEGELDLFKANKIPSP